MDQEGPVAASVPRFRPVFVMEQMLGHVTHSANLERILAPTGELEPTFLKISGELDGWASHVPGWSNWTIRSGVRARRSLREDERRHDGLPDAAFVHTQVPAVLLGRWMHRIPTVVSLDGTPRQYDAFGEFYEHDVRASAAEDLKHRIHRRTFRRARHLVTWSRWAKRSLIDDYGVPPGDVSVISPGVDLDVWTAADRRKKPALVRILFVGADLERKGGSLLVAAADRLRSDPSVPEFEVHLVTKPGQIVPTPRVVLHHDVRPNSPELLDLFRTCQVFCVPTYADMFGMVFLEAAASCLPVVATEIAAVPELVVDGETGLLVPPGNGDALELALKRLITDESLRDRMGNRGRALVLEQHDAARNAAKIVDLLRGVAVDA